MPQWIRISRVFALLHDIIWIPLAWLGAFWLRYNLEPIPAESLAVALHTLPWITAVQLGTFHVFGLYRGVWRYVSLPDLKRILFAVAAGTGIQLTGLFFFTRMDHLPRSVIPIYVLLLVAGLSSGRFLYRTYKERNTVRGKGPRLLIIGAGKAAEGLVRDLRRFQRHAAIPVGLVDDNPSKLGRELQGLRVLGTTESIPQLVDAHRVDRLVIAIPSANAADMRRLVDIAKQSGRPVYTLPALADIMSGRVSMNQVREVHLDDLLGRDPVKLDWDAIGHQVQGTTVLVTGGGGSIGSELCRQLMRLQPKRLIAVDSSEYNLFQIEREFAPLKTQCTVQFIPKLVDVCDEEGLERLFLQYQPSMVLHAAAYKHVPLLETHLREAIRNNILGTYDVAKMAIRYGVEKFILVSSDKAVNPTNVMGATKRVAEKLCQYLNGPSRTLFLAVRFGNVLGSRGSVVETFRQQLKAGGPITVTHPDITRFFMTIPEASQLILQAATMGTGGEIFTLDMGESIKIRYLAEQMIRLAGKRVNEDIMIEYTGLRPGEKLYEELFHDDESLSATGHPKILKAKLAHTERGFERWMTRLETACARCDDDEMRQLLQHLVPEYVRPDIPQMIETE